MKALLSIVVGGLILAAGVGSSQDPTSLSQEDYGPRLTALEREIQTLQKENAELRELLGTTVAYLQSQARASKVLLATLDNAEREGFTKGINFQSRETLLAGLRAYWQGAGTGVPSVKAKPEEKAPDPRTTLRRTR